MTSEQVRAARMLLRWEQKDLAEASGISLPAIKRIETIPGPLAAQSRTVEAIRAAFDGAGIIFVEENGEGPGVRLKKSSETVADLTRQIDIRQTEMTPEPDHEKPSPNRAMKQRRAHDQNALAVLKNRREKARKKEKK